MLSIMAAVCLAFYWLFIAQAQKAGTPPNVAGFYSHIVCLGAALGTIMMGRRWHIVGGALRHHTKLYLLIGLIGGLLATVSINGLPMSSLGSLGILSSTDILFTVLFGLIIFHERIRWASLIAVATIMIGAGVRIGGGQVEVSRAHQSEMTAMQKSPAQAEAQRKQLAREHVRRLMGDCMFVIYAILLSLNAFLIKRLLQYVTWDVILLSNYSFRLIFFAVLSLTWHEFPASSQLFAANPVVLQKLLAAGAIMAVQMTLYYNILCMIPVWVVKTFMMCGPVCYFIVEFLAFGKRPSPDVYFGAFLVLSGALYILLTDPLFKKTPVEAE